MDDNVLYVLHPTMAATRHAAPEYLDVVSMTKNRMFHLTVFKYPQVTRSYSVG